MACVIVYIASKPKYRQWLGEAD